MTDKERAFAFEYNFAGERYGGTVVARTWEEAREKVKAMGLGTVIGSDGVMTAKEARALLSALRTEREAHPPANYLGELKRQRAWHEAAESHFRSLPEQPDAAPIVNAGYHVEIFRKLDGQISRVESDTLHGRRLPDPPAHPPAAASDEETYRAQVSETAQQLAQDWYDATEEKTVVEYHDFQRLVVDLDSAITAARKEEQEKAEGRITELALQMRGLADKLATAEAERFDEIKENAAYHSRAFVAERDLATARRSALEEAARIVLTNTLEWPPTRNELAAAIRSAIEPKDGGAG